LHRSGLLPQDAVRLLGVSEEVGRKLLASAFRGEPDLSNIKGVKKALLAELSGRTTARPLKIAARDAAPDGFVKYLFELHDGQQVEAVRIPVPCEAPGADTSAYEGKEKKYIVCVSSQAGCALACAFCCAPRPTGPCAAWSSWAWASPS
jgi:23S rRNA (adenine2503-C2)-methyltransferase